MKRKTLIKIIGIVSFLIVVAVIFSDVVIQQMNQEERNNWSQEGYNARHTGKSLVDVGNGNKTLLWRKTYDIYLCEDRRDSLLFYNGVLYHYIGEFYLFTGGYLEAVNPKNGKVLWSIRSIYHLTDMAVSQNTIYLGAVEKLYALYLNGSLKWEMNLGEGCEFLTVSNDGIIYCNDNAVIYVVYPTDAGGLIKWGKVIDDGVYGHISQYGDKIYFVTANNNGKNYLYALNSSNGSVEWKYQIPINGSASPPSIDTKGTAYFLVYGNFSTYLFAVNSDGAVKWIANLNEKIWNGKIAIDDDLSSIYVAGECSESFISVDMDTGKIKWVRNENFPVCDFVIGGDGTIYVHSDDGIHALYPSGKEKWSFVVGTTRSFSKPSPIFYNSIIIAEGFVFAASIFQFYAVKVNSLSTSLIIFASIMIATVAVIFIIGWRKAVKKNDRRMRD